MFTWKLVKTFNKAEVSQWELVAEQVLGKTVHAARRNSFILAREALRELLLADNLKVEISDLLIKDHHLLPKFPTYTISLSHSKIAGAAIIAEQTKYRSVGIDIEEASRVVKDYIIERISHSHDVPLTGIVKWCLKEAVFKCLMNTGNFSRPFEFAEISLSEGKWFRSPSGFHGCWLLEIQENHVVAIAYLEN